MRANDLEGVLACATYQGLLGANTVQDVAITDSHNKTSGNLSAGWVISPQGGAPMVLRGRFETAERRHGRWVYLADHASAEPPPTESTK